MTLANIRDWLKTLECAEHYYIGKLDRKPDKALGVYSRESTGTPPIIAIGGPECTKTLVKRISILLHWTHNANETEQAALMLFEKLRAVDSFQTGPYTVDYLRLMVPEPVDVGTDEDGVYERVVWFDLYYRKEV